MNKYPIIINKIKEHKKHKSILLNHIQNFKKKHDTRYQSIDSDWNLSRDLERKYIDYFYSDVIEPVMINIGKELGFGTEFNWHISNTWFQQYGKSETHKWHNHPNGQFTNCYYLELPDSRYKTEIIGMDGKKINFEALEGDVVTIPAWMKHRSPSNSGERKTVIAFNSNYDLDLSETYETERNN